MKSENSMNKCTITIGCIMAMASEQDSGEITSTSEGDPVLAFCFMSESEDHTLIPTSQGIKLAEMGYLPICVAKIHRDNPSEFLLRALNGLSASLRLALHHKASDLVRAALEGLSDRQN
jgi:hypothetical protein